MFLNEKDEVSKMMSPGSDEALNVLIENNAEERDNYEKTRYNGNTGMLELKPKNIHVTLHNPKEPANIRSNSFKIPLGYSTTVYITPKATEIDDTGKLLSESQRSCRLTEDNKDLDIFNHYSSEGCLLECKIKLAFKKCGCFPWDYIPIVEKVNKCF